MEICDCKNRYTIEPRNGAYTLYMGRCPHRHGYNLATITDVAFNCDVRGIVRLLNFDDDDEGEIND